MLLQKPLRTGERPARYDEASDAADAFHAFTCSNVRESPIDDGPRLPTRFWRVPIVERAVASVLATPPVARAI